MTELQSTHPTQQEERGSCQTKKCPSEVCFHKWKHTGMLPVFRLISIQLVSEQWSILQERTYGSLYYCLQIVMASSLEKNCISLPYWWSLVMRPATASGLCGRWHAEALRATVCSPGPLFSPVNDQQSPQEEFLCQSGSWSENNRKEYWSWPKMNISKK